MVNFTDTTQPKPDNHFVFVAPMYKASETLPRLIHSLLGQSYEDWRLILIDDTIDDENERRTEQRIVFDDFFHTGGVEHIESVWNDTRMWEVANVLKGISMCHDDVIVCRIDADDYLTDLDALYIINETYKQTDCDCLWTAHRWGFSDKNISGPLPDGADPYQHPWVTSHLKTFRKRLINDVKDENFRGEDGKYVRRAGDQAIYLPILHQATKRVFVPRVMYHYTIEDRPETYQTDDARFQRDEALFLRKRGYVE